MMRQSVSRKTLAACLAALLLAGAGLALRGAPATLAQDDPDWPPTILSFTADPPSTPLAWVERGGATITLRWRVAHLGASTRLRLETYRERAWVSLLDTPEALPPVGARQFTLTHPMNFGPPTFRLSVVGADACVLDERTVSIPYNTQDVEGRPEIALFAVDVTDGGANAPPAGRDPQAITVIWHVVNRLPTSNLAFVQVLADGSTVSVERPRPALWVASSGQGVVTPVRVAGGDPILLRLIVGDVITGEVYDEATIEVGASAFATPPPTPVQTEPPRPTATRAGRAAVVFFTAAPNPADRGGAVTLTWAVRGAARVRLWRLHPDYNFNDPWFRADAAPLASDLPASGAWTYDVPPDSELPLRFELEAFDADGGGASVRSDVIALACYPFFFSPAPACATAPPEAVAARYQAFGRGHVIWRADTSTFYALYDSRPGWDAYMGTWTDEAGNVNVDAALLGAPVGAAEDYTARLQFALFYETSDAAYVSLPDGRVVQLLGIYGVDLSRGGPAWRFVEPAPLESSPDG